MLLMGLDIGTSGCKSTVCDERGGIRAVSYREYNVDRQNGGHSLDACMLWDKVKEVVSQSAKEAGGEITAMGISSFGESAVAVDINGQPLAPVMLYTDPRGAVQSEQLAQKLGGEQIMEWTGCKPSFMYTLPKLMYIRQEQPRLYQNTYKFLLIEDYIIFRLTGEAVIDYSLAARTMALDIRKKSWCAPVLEAGEISSEKLSRPVPSGTPAGLVRPEMAAELGLHGKTMVVTGGHDQACAAVGAGVLAPGLSVDGTGTVECITPVFDRPLTNRVMYAGGYACVPHALEGLYQTYAFSFTGGALLKWFRDSFGQEAVQEAAKKNISPYKLLDSRVKPGPSGLLVLPYFAGAATPRMDDRAIGAILGLTLETTTYDIYRGLMEGVTYEMRYNLELLEQAGISVGQLRTTGGGAASPVWLQIKADILGKPVMSLDSCEAGTLGAIMLAGKAAGAFATLEEGTAALLRTGRIYEPNMAFRERYEELYEGYKKIYPFTKEIYR